MRNPFKREPDPFAPSRYSDMFRGVRTRERKHMRHRWQWIVLGVFLVIVLISGFGIYKYYELQNDIQGDGPGDIGGGEVSENEPFNVLLVGSDSREGLTEEEQFDLGAEEVGGQRADTLILAHIDPDNDHIIMVQFPRDLYVDIGDRDARINEPLIDGPRRMVSVVEDLTDLNITKYIQVNIAGFRDVVDAIGGVDICIPEPIPFDSQTGIEVTEDEVGMVHFDGDRAIRFVRSRKVFSGGDFDRIQNQQRFLSAAIRKLTSVESLLNPTRVLKLMDIAGDNLSTDKSITVLGVKRILDRFREFNPERYEAYTAPNFGVGAVGEASVVLPDYDSMKVLFEAIEDNESPAEADGVPNIAPNTIRVGVYNGTFEEGVASTAADELEEATRIQNGPVQIVEVTNAESFKFKETVILYNSDEPEAEKMAELVSAAIPSAEVEEGRTQPGIDVAVIVGKKPSRIEKIAQILPLPLPIPGELPKVCQEG